MFEDLKEYVFVTWKRHFSEKFICRNSNEKGIHSDTCIHTHIVHWTFHLLESLSFLCARTFYVVWAIYYLVDLQTILPCSKWARKGRIEDSSSPLKVQRDFSQTGSMYPNWKGAKTETNFSTKKWLRDFGLC